MKLSLKCTGTVSIEPVNIERVESDGERGAKVTMKDGAWFRVWESVEQIEDMVSAIWQIMTEPRRHDRPRIDRAPTPSEKEREPRGGDRERGKGNVERGERAARTRSR